jgi:hypothetical protein
VAKVIEPVKTAFLKHEIESGDDRRKKSALQELSRLYRTGQILNSENRNAFELLINGIVLSTGDLKVVRWCLNTLARLGTRQKSSNYVELAMKKHEQCPEIIAAGVAAMTKFYNGKLDGQPGVSAIDPTIRTLAQMQVMPRNRVDTTMVKIEIDRADEDVLKLALITVGLNRDVPNLFHPHHSNGQIVKVLCQHDDPIVRQYCVWCVIENALLSVEDLGIRYDAIEDQPENVQAKLYQLIAEQEKDPTVRHSIIYDGSYCKYASAREGLALCPP